MGKKRKVPGVNATSSADIAFMLLLFFLLTTSMNTDQGLARRLPPPPDKETLDKPIDIKKRNMLRLLVNLDGQILCGDEFIDISQLKDRAKEFIANPRDDEHLPEKIEEVVPFFDGRTMICKPHVISLQNDRGTSYQKYLEVQNELAAAYRELRDDLSMMKWNKKFNELDEEHQKAVQTIYPQHISEAEPKNYGDKK
ncbi:MAG: biopolymer transporter ExbD [Tannerella sp.]|jgi:biopolymer transport protein ExbD|nr:biopolymer transporter ExbD [Tannerella sp.]